MIKVIKMGGDLGERETEGRNYPLHYDHRSDIEYERCCRG
jgi:hypothetical protein